MIQADPAQIEQVIVNLAVNAGCYGSGGRLIIRTDVCSVPASESNQVVALQPGNYAELTVTDTGCGMPSEVQAKIFRTVLYHQADWQRYRSGTLRCARYRDTKWRGYCCSEPSRRRNDVSHSLAFGRIQSPRRSRGHTTNLFLRQ